MALSSDWGVRAPEYDVIVVGSGYGGGIAAARLAMADIVPKPSICVLERGKEWIPGSFPDNEFEALQNFVSPLNPLGLYEIARHREISILQGRGLGGTSLVNANVAIIPEDGVFTAGAWPAALQMPALRPFYQRAAETLGVSEHPRGSELLKVRALGRGAGDDPEARFELLRLAVNFDRSTEHLPGDVDENGMRRRPCTDCGDCVTGCNVGAKNTVYMTYLPLARKHGAEIFTQVRVTHVRSLPAGGYEVHYERHAHALAAPENGHLRARRMVVLAAGSLGSTEILLRSRERGLPLPDSTGTRFSGNGDFFGITYNSDQQSNIMGFGNHPEQADRAAVRPGPTIVGVIRYNRHHPLHRQLTFQDLSVPRAGLGPARRTLPYLNGQDMDSGLADHTRELLRIVRDLRWDPRGALNHSMCYLVMSHDDSGGRMQLENDRLRIDWPGAGGSEVYRAINEKVERHARVLGGTAIVNPVWKFLDLQHLLTAHPLGGCPIGESHGAGAVDDRGRVFNDSGARHPGLYVADGSIVPTALGVNPFLTICSLAERSAEQMISELRGIGVGVPA